MKPRVFVRLTRRRSRAMFKMGFVVLLTATFGCNRKLESLSKVENSKMKGKSMTSDIEDIDKLRAQPPAPDKWRKISDSRLASVKAFYSGTIDADASQQEASEHMARVASLMAEWNPVRRSVEDVKKVLGKPSTETMDTLVYRFDTGWGGCVWTFLVDGSVVTGVEWIPME